MFRLSRKMLAVFAAATLLGACLHFVYALFPNPVTALISPTCESLWEHLKLLFWPYLAAMCFLTRGGEKGCRAPWMLSLLLLSGTAARELAAFQPVVRRERRGRRGR